MKKILAIDNDEYLEGYYEALFSSAGYDVRTERDAAAGLRRLHEFRPDLLVLAAALPCGVNECLTGAARHFPGASMPVIFVAWPPERVPAPAPPQARVRVVRKPLRAGELLRAAAELLAGG